MQELNGHAIDAEQERSRQRALDAYHIVDSLPEGVYNDVVHVAAAVCDTPIALVSLIDRDCQWFKARTGLDATETVRDIAVCDHAIRNKDELFEIADLSRDERFANNPLVTGELALRFYAGMPLVTPDGHAIGTVCVIDHVPRVLNEAQRSTMRALARITMELIENCGKRRHELQREVHIASGLAAPGATHASGFVAAIVELQDHAGLAAEVGESNAEQLLYAMEESLALLLPADCPGAVSRNPGSPECTMVFEGNNSSAILQSVEAFIASHERDTGIRVLLGAARSLHPDEPMQDVFLRADEALSLAKDAARA